MMRSGRIRMSQRVKRLSALFASLLLWSSPAWANRDENEAAVDKWIVDTTEYVKNKCGAFSPQVTLIKTGIDYEKDPSTGTPTTVDRVTAPLYAIAEICEKGTAATGGMLRKLKP